MRFCWLYAVDAVDAVLAFSSAELGPQLGSLGGFTLYMFYTTSTLLVAKPVLRRLGSKNGVLFGLIGMLAYVTTFLLATIFDRSAAPVFITGCVIGGVLWTSHGSYYASNADSYSLASGSEYSTTINNFAAIFAMSYLFMEAGLKILATFVCASCARGDNTSHCKVLIFAIYVVVALIATLLFHIYVLSWNVPNEKITFNPSASGSQHGLMPYLNSRDLTEQEGNERKTDLDETIETTVHNPLSLEVPESEDNDNRLRRSDIKNINTVTCCGSVRSSDISAVFRMIITQEKLRCILPFQMSFGIHVALMNTYIHRWL